METGHYPIGRREARKQERRAAIIAAARRSFLEDGYAATSMSALVDTLGGSKATLWSYFRSKEELFAAVIEECTLDFRHKLEEDLLAQGDLPDRLLLFCCAFLNRIVNADAIAIWRLVVFESGRAPELGRIFYERVARHIEHALAEYISSQIRVGRLRNENPVLMADFLISLCVAQQTKRLFDVAGESQDLLAAQFVSYFLRLFALD